MLNSREIEDLKPYVAYLCRRLIDECKKVGIELLVTGTLRDQEQQDVYYKQGTGSKLLGPHGYGLAFDVVPLTGGKPDWGNKTKWQKVGDLGKSLGLEWGGDWKKRVDCPHFQFVGGLTDSQIRAGMLPKFPSIPSTSKVSIELMVITNVLNCRKNPGTKYDVLKQYKKGDKLTAVGIVDGWYKLDVNGTPGYVIKEPKYIKEV